MTAYDIDLKLIIHNKIGKINLFRRFNIMWKLSKKNLYTWQLSVFEPENNVVFLFFLSGTST